MFTKILTDVEPDRPVFWSMALLPDKVTKFRIHYRSIAGPHPDFEPCPARCIEWTRSTGRTSHSLKTFLKNHLTICNFQHFLYFASPFEQIFLQDARKVCIKILCARLGWHFQLVNHFNSMKKIFVGEKILWCRTLISATKPYFW